MEIDDEKLIACVAKCPEFYNTAHAKYMDTNWKTKIWHDIGKELKQEGLLCKARWTNIRDNYRKSLKKIKMKSGLSTKKIRTYKYAEHLSFLNVFLDERKTKGNIESPEQYPVVEYDAEEEQEDNIGYQLEPKLEPEPEAESRKRPRIEDMGEESQEAPIKKMPKKQPETASSTIMKYLLNKNISKSSSASPATHPVDLFLSSISASLKTLDPYSLNLAKSEIFATTQKYELKMLMGSSTSQESSRIYCRYSPSPSPTTVATPIELPTSDTE